MRRLSTLPNAPAIGAGDLTKAPFDDPVWVFDDDSTLPHGLGDSPRLLEMAA